MRSSRRRWTTALATLLLVAVVAGWVFGALLSELSSEEPFPLIDVVWVLSFLVFPVVGWLISVKFPSNPLGWIYLALAIFAAVGTAMEELSTVQAHAGNLAVAAVLMQAGGWMFALALTLVLGPGVLLFPDGQLPGRRWRFVLWGTGALVLVNAVFIFFGDPSVCVESVWEGGVYIECAMRVDNPLLLPLIERLNTDLGPAIEPLLALVVGLSLAGLLMRYRQSTGEVRQQIKWVVFAAAVGIVSLLLTALAQQLLGFTALQGLDTLLLMFITISLPIAIGVAIFKYRLYDIDRIISRTAAYAIVVGLLSIVFLLSVLLMQRLLPIEGQFGIVVSTLVVAALFNPLRLRVQGAVDRRFNRSRYDTQRVLDEFAVQLPGDVDLELMQVALMSAADDTMQPSHLSLWIRDRMPNRG